MNAPSRIEEALAAPASTTRQTRHLYVLVDHGGAPGLLRVLHYHSLMRWQSLLGPTDADTLAQAPLLIDLGPCNVTLTPAGCAMCRWLEQHCATSHAATWIRSTWAFDALADALAARLDAVLPERWPTMLRYFDSRVLPAVLRVLTPEQAAGFLCAGERWSWLDRAGQPQHLDAVHGDVDSHRSPMVLNEAQALALLQAAEPDAVMQCMLDRAADALSPFGPAALHELVVQCLPVAKRFHLGGLEQQAMFCVTAAIHGLRFYEQADWRDKLEAVARDNVDFSAPLSWGLPRVTEPPAPFELRLGGLPSRQGASPRPMAPSRR